MRREVVFNREIAEVFISPERYTLSFDEVTIELAKTTIRRDREQLEFAVYDLLLTAPMSVERMEECRVVELHLQRSRVEWMSSYKVVSAKFSSVTQPSRSILADIVVQRVPQGIQLDMWSGDVAALHRAINLLDKTLRADRAYFTTLNLDSVVVGADGLLYPYRYDKLRFGRFSGCETECERLRAWVVSHFSVSEVDGLPTSEYPLRSGEPFDGYLSTGVVSEERVAVEALSGWGFVDLIGEEIVPPHYNMVYPYSEGRAVVQSEQGWGLIDLNGREVIAARYESIGYNSSTGISCVREGGLWGYFSYVGEQLTDIVYPHPNEDITALELGKGL